MSIDRVDVTPPVPATIEGAGQRKSGASWSARAQVLLLTAVMGAAAVVLSLPHLEGFPPERIPNPEWWALLVVFAAGEAFVIHLPAVHSAHSLTLRDIPAVVGLAFLSGPEYISAYVLGAALALLWSRQSGVKFAFNAAMFSLEASVGLLTYHAVLGDSVVTGPRGWAAALAAVLLTGILSAVAVTAAITLTERRIDDEVLREVMRSGLPGAVVTTCVALLLVVLLVSQPSALVLLALVVVLLAIAYRAYVSMVIRYARLEHLYRFVGTTGRSADLDDVVGAVLTEAAALLRATEAVLVVLPASGEPGSRTRLRGGVIDQSPLSASGHDTSWWEPALRGTPVLRVAAEGGARRATDPGAGNHRDGLAVPMPTGEDDRAVLLVVDRTFEQETFGTVDLTLLETLAGHAAVTFDNARLVDRLRRLAEQRQHEATHDVLTGMPNRSSFQESMKAAAAHGDGGAVLLIDLDDFKDVNDTLGHDAGDLLLEVTGTRLQEYRRGMVARLGGDEFAILLPGTSLDEAMRHARALRQIISEPMHMRDITLITSASIGVASLPGDGSAGEQTLAHADVAMYAAKRAKSGVELYAAEETASVHRRLTLAGDLAQAIERRVIEVFFQPQVEASDGTVIGMEALLRWHHPLHGPIPPPEVIAVAERTGLGRVLAEHILREALQQRARWAVAGHELMVSVNITPQDLGEERLLDTVARLLITTDTPPGALTLEITEHDVMSDPDRCIAVLRGLCDLGIQLSVDDFGTGHSSLAYLEELPVHEVKIDRAFVGRLENDQTDAAIVRATVMLSHELGLRVVAEGVETDHVLRRARALGCDVIQGFGIARPMSADLVIPWLSEHTAVRNGIVG